MEVCIDQSMDCASLGIEPNRRLPVTAHKPGEEVGRFYLAPFLRIIYKNAKRDRHAAAFVSRFHLAMRIVTQKAPSDDSNVSLSRAFKAKDLQIMVTALNDRGHGKVGRRRHHTFHVSTDDICQFSKHIANAVIHVSGGSLERIMPAKWHAC